MALGALCLVLHGHLPWVLHHGRWPHGEDWLFEAAAETWLPLLAELDALVAEGRRPAFSIGLTPVLLEQLAHPRFRSGMVRWLHDMIARARDDERDFSARGEGALAVLARRHQERLAALGARFEGLAGGIPGAFARLWEAGAVELLTSNATHGYHPLILHDACARAQVRAGVATSRRHLGRAPTAAWLPECAYRPPGPWRPPVLHGDLRERHGVGALLADEGVRCFFVEGATLARGRSAGQVVRDGLIPLAEGPWPEDPAGWNSPLEPHRLVEGHLLPISVLARCPEVSEQVWSAQVGYPGDPRHQEFHKRHGLRGLRYWRVTGAGVDLGDKEPYDPQQALAAVHEHADHLLGLVRGRLRQHHARTGRRGVVCAPFDAELFGHWWSEGPAFLGALARRVADDPEIGLVTATDALEMAPPDKAVALPEGSWGEGGDHRVWLNDGLRFYWEQVGRAEDRFLDLWHRAPWRRRGRARTLLGEAARQLLLLQASDWPFVISTGGAVDYGLRRIAGHAARFDDLCNGVEDVLAGRPADPVVRRALRASQADDGVFPDLDLAWWA